MTMLVGYAFCYLGIPALKLSSPLCGFGGFGVTPTHPYSRPPAVVVSEFVARFRFHDTCEVGNGKS
jgi:hypothetical protein